MKSVAMGKPMRCIIANNGCPTFLKKTFQLNNKLDNLPVFELEAHSKSVFLAQ